MQVVTMALLKEISIGKDTVSVKTEPGGHWDLTPQHAAQILDHVTTLPEGRKVEQKMLSNNRNIFARLHREALGLDKPTQAVKQKPKKDHKLAIEKAPEQPEKNEE